MLNLLREVPPTAGLPLHWRDFLPASGPSLEAELATFLQMPSVQIECSGTAALIVALTTLKRISTRRSVIIPAYTCPLVALAIRHCGLKPVLCDLRRNHFDLSPQALEEACDNDTLAIIPTHLGGRVADIVSVKKIALRIGALVIEDAAQSLGAAWQGQPVGALGDAGFYSLAVGKGLTLYEGGVLIAHDADLRQRLHETSKQIVPYRLIWEIRRLLELACYTALYRPFGLRLAYGAPLRRALRKNKFIEAVGDDFSFDIPMHHVGAWRRTIGVNALTRLPSFLKALSEQAIARKKILETIPGVTVMDDPEGGRGIWPCFMVLMPTTQTRDTALTKLWPAGLGVSRLFIHALPDYPYLATQFSKIDVPNARDFAARLLTISNSPWLREADFLQICSVLAERI